MSVIQSIILGTVQGLTEFLPVSSSGHLALLQNFFGIDSDKVLLFTVLLHVGTLISVFFVYWKDIKELVIELGLTISDLAHGRGLRLEERPVRKLGIMIIVATIPTVIMALLFKNFFESLYGSLLGIGIGFMFTALILFLANRQKASTKKIEKMNFRNAIFVGVLQGIAICPGVSRSGSTLVGGLFAGLEREFAVKFAFLISIPSILGSFILELPDAIKAGSQGSMFGIMILGIVVAAVSGILAIKVMIKAVVNNKLSYFSIYVGILGLGLIGYSLFA